MKRWLVFTPQYECHHATEADPAEFGCDVVEIEAKTKRDALALGVKVMLADRRHFHYCRDQRDDNASPYAGLKVEDADEFLDEIDNPTLESV